VAGAYCEKNGSDTTGMVLNPDLLNTTAMTVFPKPTDSLKSFMTSLTSPCRNTGLDLKTKFGIDMGTRDYWGNALKNENAYDIGAYEWSTKTSSISSIVFAGLKLYPNPIGKDKLIIEVPQQNTLDIQCKILDMTGKLCLEQILYSGSNILPTQDLPKGIYTIIVNNAKSAESFKLIKIE
jgi:hypothetical protein